MGKYITQTDCERRITSAVLIQIFDDDLDGVADVTTVSEFIEDSEAIIEAAIAKIYGEGGLSALRTQGTSCPRLVKKLCLDAFEVLAEKRHPEYIRSEWIEQMKMLRQSLEDLRLRHIELDVIGSPEPAENEGGTVESGDPDDTDPKDKFALDGTGAF